MNLNPESFSYRCVPAEYRWMVYQCIAGCQIKQAPISRRFCSTGVCECNFVRVTTLCCFIIHNFNVNLPGSLKSFRFCIVLNCRRIIPCRPSAGCNISCILIKNYLTGRSPPDEFWILSREYILCVIPPVVGTDSIVISLTQYNTRINKSVNDTGIIAQIISCSSYLLQQFWWRVKESAYWIYQIILRNRFIKW